MARLLLLFSPPIFLVFQFPLSYLPISMGSLLHYLFFISFLHVSHPSSPNHSLSLSLCGPNLHAVQRGAGAAHAASPEAALLGQRPIAQGQQLAAYTQVLLAQPRLKAALGVLAQQLAATADVLRAELGERGRAVSIVPAETVAQTIQGKGQNKTHGHTHTQNQTTH